MTILNNFRSLGAAVMRRLRERSLTLLRTIVLLLLNFKLFGFAIFRFRAYMMKVIPETRRVQYLWYLGHYQNTCTFLLFRN
jgi:hypothetical protein